MRARATMIHERLRPTTSFMISFKFRLSNTSIRKMNNKLTWHVRILS